MSTRPRPQAGFIQGNQSTVEQEASPSALFYLFQEVSKLASPTHSSFLDSNSSPKWLNETSRQDNSILQRDRHDACFFQTSTSCQHSLSHMSTYNQVNSVKEENHRSKVATLLEPHHECSSPWKVLSLINLQCERLMHRSDVEELNPSSVSPAKSGHSAAKFASQQPTTASLLKCERHRIGTSTSPVEDVRGGCTQGVSNSKPQFYAKDNTVDSDAQAPCAEKHRDKMEVMLNVNGQLVWNQEHVIGTFSSEQDILKVPFSENALLQISRSSHSTHLTFDSNADASVALSKPALTLDYNANITLATEPQCETQVPPLSSTLPSSMVFGSTDFQSLPEQSDEELSGCKPESTHVPTEEESSPILKSCNLPLATSKTDPRLGLKEDNSQQWRTKTPRKQPNPSRSVDIRDPDLQGVAFRMDTEVDDNKEQCRLLITSKFRKELCKTVRKPRLRTRTSKKCIKTSSSDDESDPATNVSKGKVCASCCTRKTPMWRDAEDGTPLCNACGIRYKKYRVRCVNCWHIPRKEGNSNSCCRKCGNLGKLVLAQRKHTT